MQLDVQSRVLAQCIMAVTSRVSTHPALVGADVSDAQLAGFLSSGNLMMTPGLDLRELGRRRDPMCRRLHDEACQLAHEAGIMMVASEENAASLYLLDFLESCTSSRLQFFPAIYLRSASYEPIRQPDDVDRRNDLADAIACRVRGVR